MKIKIIKSPNFAACQLTEYFPPLSIALLYSFLKDKGFDIVQEDLNISLQHSHTRKQREKTRKLFSRLFLDNERLLSYLRGRVDREYDNIVNRFVSQETFKGIDILLISIFSLDTYSAIMAVLFARNFKAVNRQGLVIVGGEWLQQSYVYDNFELYNRLGIIDYYIAGYGEEPLYKLLKRIQGEAINLKDIPGLCYCKDDKIYRPTRFADQILTMPNFDGLPLLSYRWNKSAFFRRISRQTFADRDVLMLPTQMIYGCPNRCAFCPSCGYKKLYYIDPEEAAENLGRLAKHYNTPYFFFMDDGVSISEKFVAAFCDKILNMELKVYWAACATVKQINNPEILMKMRKAGACRLIFGLETASPRLLQLINKNIELQDASRVLRWSHEAGIWTGLEIIAGLPHENQEDVRMTVDFLQAHRQYLDEVWPNRFYLAIGSDMFNFPQEYGIRNISDYYQLSQILQTGSEVHRYSFDEIGGLAWEEKKQQIDESYDTVIKALRDYGLLTDWEVRDALNVLFYLYSCLSDKGKIKAYLQRYRNRWFSRKVHSAFRLT